MSPVSRLKFMLSASFTPRNLSCLAAACHQLWNWLLYSSRNFLEVTCSSIDFLLIGLSIDFQSIWLAERDTCGLSLLKYVEEPEFVPDAGINTLFIIRSVESKLDGLQGNGKSWWYYWVPDTKSVNNLRKCCQFRFLLYR
jgi:hypothetical protein